MKSQIAKWNLSPSRGLLHAVWRDWVAGAVLLVVWTVLWTVFTAGVLAPASRLGTGAALGKERAPATQTWVAAR